MGSSRVKELAYLSVSRGCGFAGLAILCFMVGLAGFPSVALRTGAVLMMASAAILALKADSSLTRPYRRTELWIMLDAEERPRADFAQRVIGLTQREAYQRFAVIFAAGAGLCFLAALMVPD